MRKKLFFTFLSISLICSFSLQAYKKPNLPGKYKKWIKEEVVYIITPKEKEVFYKLETDKERDLFIEEFWRQRDPTPGTPRNEFKEEHYRRISYANKNFGRGNPINGWRTDRGRIYIKLGEPMQIMRYDSMEIYPVETWYYQGNPKFGQAPIFRLLFFKKYGGGAYELYSPMSDGPKKLVPSSIMQRPESDIQIEWQDKMAYKFLKGRISTELAEASLSCFPKRDGWEFRLPSETLMGEVRTYPYKKVQEDYAYDFLEHKPIVEVSYSVYYISNQAKVSVIQDKSGLFFVNYLIEPEKLSLDFYQDKYSANIKTSMRVTDSKDNTIFQQERNVPIELKKEQLKNVRQRPFHFCDSFPIIPGDYTLNLLMENTVTKEFTSLEKNISVPERESFQMSDLILADKVNKDSPYNQVNKAFQIGKFQIYPSLRNTFPVKGKLFMFFQIYGLSQERGKEGILEFSFYKQEKRFHTLIREISEYESTCDFLEEFSLEKFPPGKYVVKVSLLDGERKEIVSKRENFSVSSKFLPLPWIVTETNPPVDDAIYSFYLGNQFLNNGEIEKACGELEKAWTKEPDMLDYAISYARVLLVLKKFKDAQEVLFPFLEANKANFTLLYYLGKTSQETGKFEEAISYYREALSHKGNVLEILNSIGECYHLLGDNNNAVQVWQKSLEINPNQEKIKKKIEGLKEEK